MPNNIGVVVTGTPTAGEFWTLRFIDADGTLRAYPLRVNAAMTDIELNAMLDSIGVGSNASLYALEHTMAYGTVPQQSNAIDAVHTSVKDAIALLAKDIAANRSQTIYVPAPSVGNFVANTDTPDPSTTPLSDIIAAVNTVTPVNQTVISARFTQRRQTNERVRI